MHLTFTLQVFDVYAQKKNVAPSSLKFVFEGQRLSGDMMPEDLGLGDSDVVDVSAAVPSMCLPALAALNLAAAGAAGAAGSPLRSSHIAGSDATREEVDAAAAQVRCWPAWKHPFARIQRRQPACLSPQVEALAEASAAPMIIQVT